MIMSEKPNDGTVAMHIGEIEDAEYFTAEDYLPTLPNTVSSEHTICFLWHRLDTLLLCCPLVLLNQVG